jgi:hypothetical protein
MVYDCSLARLDISLRSHFSQMRHAFICPSSFPILWLSERISANMSNKIPLSIEYCSR